MVIFPLRLKQLHITDYYLVGKQFMTVFYKVKKIMFDDSFKF